MGKTDIRDPEQVAAEHPGVAYRAFDLVEAGPERIGEMLAEIARALRARRAAPLPDHHLGHAQRPRGLPPPAARASNVGKVVLDRPAADRPRAAPS